MKEVIIVRHKVTNDYSLGRCYIKNEDGCLDEIGVSLERGWQDNKSNISCVPVGNYELKLEYSPSFEKSLWELKGVPSRSECKIHTANFWKQLNGCIALGEKFVDIDNDGDLDVTDSDNTRKYFHSKMTGNSARIIIKNL